MLPQCSDELRDLYRRDQVTAAIFDIMANYGRSLNDLKLYSLRTKLLQDHRASNMSNVVAQKLAIDFFRKLERLNLGKFVAGRRGKQSRFEWHEDVKMVEIAQCAQGGSADVPTAVVESDSLPHGSLHEDAAELRHQFVRHQFVLRSGCIVAFELPDDLTSHEANRLSCFVQTLPFSSTPQEN